MKHRTTRFKNMAIALKELEPFIRNGEHLQTGKPFDRFDGLRSREILANWLTCAAVNANLGSERLTFTSDPTGGDGIIIDTKNGETWPTEHVLVPRLKGGSPPDIEGLILQAITLKQSKGGKAYASGKTLIVFLNIGAQTKWHPTKAAKQLPENLDFEAVWVVGLQSINEGRYEYGVTRLDLSRGHAPAWLVRISKDFDAWEVEPIQ